MEIHELTPEKRAMLFYSIYPYDNDMCRQMCEIVTQIISDAVLEEREVNARIAEAVDTGVAAKIRERTGSCAKATSQLGFFG
jgi:hypothetical protein